MRLQIVTQLQGEWTSRAGRVCGYARLAATPAGTGGVWYLRYFRMVRLSHVTVRGRESGGASEGAKNMKKILVMASFLIFAGVAHGQGGATINGYGSIGDYGGLNGATSLGAGGGLSGSANINPPSSTAAVPSAPGAVLDRDVNQSSTNPGPYVPSRFTNYRDAVALGVIESGIRPLTVAEAARLGQLQKKSANAKPAILLEKDVDGKLVIAPVVQK